GIVARAGRQPTRPFHRIPLLCLTNPVFPANLSPDPVAALSSPASQPNRRRLLCSALSPRRRPAMTDAGISLDRARRHEALVVRLEALLRTVRPLAAHRPEGRVGAALRAEAEGLLFEAGQFTARRRRD